MSEKICVIEGDITKQSVDAIVNAANTSLVGGGGVRLPRIVDQAEAGIEVELTRRGRPVAILMSRQKFDRLQGKGSHFGETYRRFLEKYSVKEFGLEDDFIVSTRDKSTRRKVSL